MTLISDRLSISVVLDSGGFKAQMAEDVRKGLSGESKYLLPKYFYDYSGSRLFDAITRLPEYYLTRAELGIFTLIATELIDHVRPSEIIELGAGSAHKITHLLAASHSYQRMKRYVPFDISPDVVTQSAAILVEEFPSMRVHGIVGDIEHHIPEIPSTEEVRMVLLLGSTIGNFHLTQRNKLLMMVRDLLKPTDRLLLGIDLTADQLVLEAAYNDRFDVTAQFNRNILNVVNNTLRADFRPESYRHLAFYEPDARRVEMHLVSESDQTVYIEDLSLEIHIAQGESIWTESSYKFTENIARSMLEEAGMRIERWYTNDIGNYALVLAAPED